MSSNTPTVMNTFSGQILASKYNSPLRGTRASWDITRLIPGLEQRKKDEPGNVIVPEKNEIFKGQQREVKSTQKPT